MIKFNAMRCEKTYLKNRRMSYLMKQITRSKSMAKDLKKKNSFKTLTINGVVKTVYLPAKKTLNHKTP